VSNNNNHHHHHHYSTRNRVYITVIMT